MDESEVTTLKIGEKVKCLSETGKSHRYGTVVHIFDFRRIWPDTYENRVYIDVKIPRNKFKWARVPITRVERIK